MPEQIKYDLVTGKPIHEDSYTQPGNKLDQLANGFWDQVSLINNNQLKDGLQSKLTNSPQIQKDQQALDNQVQLFKQQRAQKKAQNDAYWLNAAQKVNPNFKSLQDVMDWQKANGLVVDGKFGKNSLAKWNELKTNQGLVDRTQTTEQSQNVSNNTASQINTSKKRWWDGFNQTNEKLVWNWRSPYLLTNEMQLKDGSGKTVDIRVDNNDQSWAIDRVTGKMRKIREGSQGEFKDFDGDWIDILPEHGVFKKHGGRITKHQQGGAMNEQEQIIRQVIQGINQGDPQIMQALSSLDKQQQQAILQSIAQLAQQGDQEAANAINKLQNPQTAKLGTKLSYIKRLKGVCPEGTEKIYLKSGGCMCQKVAKAQEGTKADKNTIEQWKKDRKKYKNDEAAKDSVAINKYNDQETIVNKGSKGTYKNGVWVPDRSKYKNVEKKACGSKMKK